MTSSLLCTISIWPIYNIILPVFLSQSNFSFSRRSCDDLQIYLSIRFSSISRECTTNDLLIANYIDRIENQHRKHSKLFTHALYARHSSSSGFDYGSSAWFQFEFPSVQHGIYTDPSNNQIKSNQINCIFQSFDWLFKPQIVLSYFSCGLYAYVLCALTTCFSFAFFTLFLQCETAFDLLLVLVSVVQSQAIPYTTASRVRSVKLQSCIIILTLSEAIDYATLKRPTLTESLLHIGLRCSCVQISTILMFTVCRSFMMLFWSFCVNCAIPLCAEIKKGRKETDVTVSCFSIESAYKSIFVLFFSSSFCGAISWVDSLELHSNALWTNKQKKLHQDQQRKETKNGGQIRRTYKRI